MAGGQFSHVGVGFTTTGATRRNVPRADHEQQGGVSGSNFEQATVQRACIK
jgi:hypothetical protein